MKKRHKKTYSHPDWEWAPVNSFYVPHGYHRRFKHAQNIARDCHDEADARDERLPVSWRRQWHPSFYDDLHRSRGFYVRSWKDAYKKRFQWE